MLPLSIQQQRDAFQLSIQQPAPTAWPLEISAAADEIMQYFQYSEIPNNAFFSSFSSTTTDNLLSTDPFNMPANNSSSDTVFQSILHDLTPACSPTAAFNNAATPLPLFHLSKPSFHVHPESQGFVFPNISATQFGGVNEFPRQSQIAVLTTSNENLPIENKSDSFSSIPIKSTSNPPPIPPTKPIKGNRRRSPKPTSPPKKRKSNATTTSIPISRSRDFQCTTCGKRCFRKQDLERHSVTHGSCKSFVCQFGCGACFARNDALTRHMKTRKCVAAGCL
ncbi:hypothetical protein BJ741DRAFT_602254 [Chytriomyces cf. hyalinus JEL632]|nr:hypothetical protein BJ741DRAFT_602254 [Chytriomyces cf. hyalinus JEL632]